MSSLILPGLLCSVEFEFVLIGENYDPAVFFLVDGGLPALHILMKKKNEKTKKKRKGFYIIDGGVPSSLQII